MLLYPVARDRDPLRVYRIEALDGEARGVRRAAGRSVWDGAQVERQAAAAGVVLAGLFPGRASRL
jgi:hypothetical protein